MTGKDPRELVYDDFDTAIIQILFGEGYLSPGGADEVAETLGPVDLTGKTTLDLGCGIGGIDVDLVKNHGAAKVVGIDISESGIAQSRRRAAETGLEDRLDFRLVEPGPLPLKDASFDVAFSSGAILHVPDKAETFGELFRVLRPGGWLVVNDWYLSEGDISPEMREWMRWNGLQNMATLEATRRVVESCGFQNIETRDRNAWYAGEVRREVDRVREAYDRIAALVGEEEADTWIEAGTLRQTAVEQGHLRPAHLRARKPAAG